MKSTQSLQKEQRRKEKSATKRFQNSIFYGISHTAYFMAIACSTLKKGWSHLYGSKETLTTGFKHPVLQRP